MDGAPQRPGTDLVLARPVGTKTRDWPPAVKCGGTRTDGKPCNRWATRGGDRCEVHGARLPCVKEAYARRVEEARRRIVNLADPALDALERALEDKDSGVAVRAAQTILDRVVPRPGTGVSVLVGIGGEDAGAGRSPAEIVRERLRRLREPTQALLAGEAERAAQVAEEAPGEATWSGEPVEGELLEPGPLGHLAEDLDDEDWS